MHVKYKNHFLVTGDFLTLLVGAYSLLFLEPGPTSSSPTVYYCHL